MKKIFRYLCPFLILLVFVLVLPAAAEAAPKYKNQIVTDDSGAHYYNSKGTMVKNRLVTVKNKTYYFNSKGVMLTDQLFSFKGVTFTETVYSPGSVIAERSAFAVKSSAVRLPTS